MNQESFTSTSTNMWALVWSPALQSDVRTILYLHGAGAFGTGMTGLFEYPDLPSLLRDGMEVGCRVVIPSCHIGEEWQPSDIASFLDDLEQEYGKPQHGYDLLGYSRGGRGAYQFAAAEPHRIRTLAVVSTRDMPEVVPQIYALPVFICHGLKDQRIPVAKAERMYETLRTAGCNCKLSLVEGDHFIIAKVLSDGHIFQWQQNAI
jgi:predicted esterase